MPHNHRRKENTLILHFSWNLQVIYNKTPYECLKSQKYIKTVVATGHAIDNKFLECVAKKKVYIKGFYGSRCAQYLMLVTTM